MAPYSSVVGDSPGTKARRNTNKGGLQFCTLAQAVNTLHGVLFSATPCQGRSFMAVFEEWH
jgi:hypothetical protein